MRFLKHSSALGFVILAAITAWGFLEFAQADPGEALAHWRGRLPLLPWILLLVCLDAALEGAGWIWVYQRFGIPARDARGVCAFLAGRAALLVPAQLGRLLRPHTMASLKRGSLQHCLKAEAVCFVLDTTSVCALLIGLVVAHWQPWAGAFVALASVAPALYLGELVATRLAGTRLALPGGFWWRWQTLAIVGVQAMGWVAHGTAFYLLIRGLAGNVTLWASIFFSTASSVAGAGSGLPGGVGATEGLLGASLRLMQVPVAHLALAVGAFRLITFWIWIPIGWIALGIARRRAAEMVETRVEVVRQPAT